MPFTERPVIKAEDLIKYTGTRRRKLEEEKQDDDEPTALIQDPLREYPSKLSSPNIFSNP